jgi:hypothetical protein
MHLMSLQKWQRETERRISDIGRTPALRIMIHDLLFSNLLLHAETLAERKRQILQEGGRNPAACITRCSCSDLGMRDFVTRDTEQRKQSHVWLDVERIFFGEEKGSEKK